MWDVSLTVSSFNMDHFSCLIFDHACFWSLGMEEISGVGIEYNVCQFGMFKINSKFKKAVDSLPYKTGLSWSEITAT